MEISLSITIENDVPLSWRHQKDKKFPETVVKAAKKDLFDVFHGFFQDA